MEKDVQIFNVYSRSVEYSKRSTREKRGRNEIRVSLTSRLAPIIVHGINGLLIRSQKRVQICERSSTMKLEIRISIDAKKLAEAWLASCMCVFLFLTPSLSLRRSFSVEEK